MVRQDYVIQQGQMQRAHAPQMSEREKERRRRIRAKRRRKERRLKALLLILTVGSLGIIGFVAWQMLPVAFAGKYVSDEVEVALGSEPIEDVSLFLEEGADASEASFITDMKAIDYDTPQEKEIEIAYKGTPSATKDIFAYVGVVYEKGAKSMSLFTSKASGESQVADAIDIDPSSANVYTFDYNERANKGVRLSVGNSATQKGQTVFKQNLINEKNTVVWEDLLDNGTPQLAFVKEVDGDATDIVYYVAP